MTTSFDQYGATLAQWSGVPATALPPIFPNLANFTTPTLKLISEPSKSAGPDRSAESAGPGVLFERKHRLQPTSVPGLNGYGWQAVS